MKDLCFAPVSRDSIGLTYNFESLSSGGVYFLDTAEFFANRLLSGDFPEQVEFVDNTPLSETASSSFRQGNLSTLCKNRHFRGQKLGVFCHRPYFSLSALSCFVCFFLLISNCRKNRLLQVIYNAITPNNTQSSKCCFPFVLCVSVFSSSSHAAKACFPACVVRCAFFLFSRFVWRWRFVKRALWLTKKIACFREWPEVLRLTVCSSVQKMLLVYSRIGV